ncbi:MULTISPECIES: family 43 glycosylhydrolase [Niastella]|uniref:Family 43 glycosylhydrolase n=1 Tax=Niastella soli TaxID=2821487 RepID=A0ABS3Z2R6_9BACT|nr:family 43 glycosylhydrolase [Niastella soli]MBO9204425.1 family 43 glycosylhydrolase [Niastella soli]
MTIKTVFHFLLLGCLPVMLKAQQTKAPNKNYHNPVLKGLYADPDIIFSIKTGKFYLYPTSDGFTNWTGTYFKAFSSPDLVNWKEEGVILDLPKEVSWAKVRAWAPCIIERKINGTYKYFFYFCGEQKIGVAVSDSPTGPFVDTGKPLIDKRPEGITKGGQTIDPDVFQDPQTGKYYLYWGNGYMAGAELNDDMVSLKMETLKELTPDKTFREGTHVFFRNGQYYFMWSQNDTRDPNYCVRYGTASGPLEKINIPANNLVVFKDSIAGIYGTGHNSTIQVPGRDEWYLVYHRFNYPNGINMGREAGYNREVCIDKMEFNADGTIKQVQPTHTGIKPVKVNVATVALNIFTLGDSNGSFPYSWPKQLEWALPGADVFNLSKSGRTIGFVNNGDSTLNSLMMIDENLKKAAEHTGGRPYDFIVLDLGTNDGKAVFANRQQEVHANLELLIRKIKGCSYPAINKASIIIIAPTPYGSKAEATEKYAGGNNRVAAMSKAFEQIAKRNGCLFVNGFKTPGLDIESMTADGLHLDNTASRKLIEPVVQLMIKKRK